MRPPRALPARDWEGLDASVTEKLMRQLGSQGIQLWAVIQWTAYQGQYLTVAIWATLIAVLLARKMRRKQRESDGVQFTFRDRAGALFRSLGRAFVMLATLTLFSYLALAPNVIKRMEQEFERNMVIVRQPSEHWAKVKKVIAEIQSDQQMMTSIKETVKAEMSSPNEAGP